MNIDKKYLEMCTQACINAYNGKHGAMDWSFLTNVESFRLPFTDGILTYYVDGYFANYEDIFMVVFQGTSGFEDWINNFKACHRSVYFNPLATDICVHDGFLDQWTVAKNLVKDKTQDKQKILITGHSLGGAIATLCAYDLRLSFVGKEITCVAIASPRVFNHAGAKDFNRILPDSYRLKLCNDMVCNVPPVAFGYWHCCNTYIHLQSYSTLDAVLHPLRTIFGNPLDHYPEKYLEAVKNL